MEQVIEEIARWRVGEPVRVDVQKRWQSQLVALDAELQALRAQVAARSEKDEPKRGRG